MSWLDTLEEVLTPPTTGEIYLRKTRKKKRKVTR
jgi:hypothetical protein